MDKRTKINLRETVQKKVNSLQRNTGCFILPLKLFLWCGLILFIGVDVLMLLSGKPIIKALPILAMEAVCVVFAIALYKSFAKTINSKKINVDKDGVTVEIVEAVVENKYTERKYHYFPNAPEKTVDAYYDLRIGDRIFKFDIGFFRYDKHQVGDRVYLIKIDDAFYEDLIFNCDETSFDSLGEQALNNKIKIRL